MTMLELLKSRQLNIRRQNKCSFLVNAVVADGLAQLHSRSKGIKAAMMSVVARCLTQVHHAHGGLIAWRASHKGRVKSVWKMQRPVE